MSAKFEVEGTFIIKGRGHVIAGRIREGTIKIGMFASVPGLDRKTRIEGIEIISTVDRPKELAGVMGLFFPFGNKSEELLWKNLDIKGQILNVDPD